MFILFKQTIDMCTLNIINNILQYIIKECYLTQDLNVRLSVVTAVMVHIRKIMLLLFVEVVIIYSTYITCTLSLCQNNLVMITFGSYLDIWLKSFKNRNAISMAFTLLMFPPHSDFSGSKFGNVKHRNVILNRWWYLNSVIEYLGDLSLIAIYLTTSDDLTAESSMEISMESMVNTDTVWKEEGTCI